MTWFKKVAFVLSVVAVGSLAYAHGDHPDIEIEVEGGNELEIHGGPILHSHDKYEFVKPGSFWQTFHSSNNWPGVGAEDGTFPGPGISIDLNIQTPLYYWDGVSPSGFSVVSDTTFIRLIDAGFVNQLDITGTSGVQTLAGIAVTNSSGGIHTHPVWRLLADSLNVGTPADGAYLIGVTVSAVGYEESNLVGILFHKGLTHEQYELAEDYALAVIPEPATLSLLAIGAVALLRRRRAA